MDRIRHQRDAFERLLFGRLTNAFAIATESERLPGTSSIYIWWSSCRCFDCAYAVIMHWNRFRVYIRRTVPLPCAFACGLSHKDARCVIRVSIGRFTSEHDLQFAIDRIVENVNAIRSYSGVSQDQFGSARMVSKA